MWIGLLACAGCGGGFNPPGIASSLSGNWLIAGSVPGNPAPSLGDQNIATAFTVSGTTVYGAGSFLVRCGPTDTAAGNFFLNGTLQPDGAFTAQSATGGFFSVSIQGTAPSASGQNWNGTYHVTIASQISTCQLDAAAPFTASAIHPVTGTFSGSGSFTETPVGGSPQTGNVTLATSLVQNDNDSPTPGALTGAIAVTGSPCFNSGTVTAPISGLPNLGINAVAGSRLAAQFTMNDGSLVQLTGTLNDQSADIISATLTILKQGNCQVGIPTQNPLQIFTLTRH